MSGAERRQFGRRQTYLRAWIIVPGRPRLPCIVQNMSVGGALLEIKAPTWLPFLFRVTIEATGFEADCELRHVSEHAIGVRFVEQPAAQAPEGAGSGTRLMADDAQQWMGARR